MRNMLTIAKEDLAQKREFLLELSIRLQTNINKRSKELQKTINTMNKVVAEIAQLEIEIKELSEDTI